MSNFHTKEKYLEQDIHKVIIVGGGLSGLALAYFLEKKGISAIILEASERLGGRIETIKGALETPLELGATWFSDLHQTFLKFIDELGLEKFPQFDKGKSLFQTKSFEPVQEFSVPENNQPSYRLAGGTSAIIEALAQKISDEKIFLNHKVFEISDFENYFEVKTMNGKTLKAEKVVLCMPPQLIGSEINFTPQLPSHLAEILPKVQTWMAGSVKFTIEYSEPFWRKNGYSGMLFSHTGPITEMYDHTDFLGKKFGFTGFLSPMVAHFSLEERKKMVFAQLKKLFGENIPEPTAYFDKIWNGDLLIAKNPMLPRPHQNNGHHYLHETYFGGKLYFAGTETDANFGGYMEGAILSAERVSNCLSEKI